MLSLTMHSLRGQVKHLLSVPICESLAVPAMNYVRVLDYPVPANYSEVEKPERARLPTVRKVPIVAPGQRILKMKRNKALQRGPELVNNTFLHKQYGIVAIDGGRMRYETFEFIRMTIVRRMKSNSFAMWRVDDPWQAISRRSQGKPMGGGQSPVDHYVTPVRAGRVIIEVGGTCTFDEVKHMLTHIAARLPFAARAYDYKTLLGERKFEELKEQQNINPYTFKYIVQNDFANCHNWIRPIDKLFYGRYQ